MKNVLKPIGYILIALIGLSGTPQWLYTQPSISFGFGTIDKRTLSGSMAPDGTPLEMHVVDWDIKIHIPFHFNYGNTRTDHTFFYKHLDKFFTGWFAAEEDETVLHGVTHGYHLEIVHDFNDRWSIFTEVAPMTRSNMELSHEGGNFELHAGVGVFRSLNDQTSLGLGVRYSTLFGDPLVYPTVGFKWDNGSNLSANAYLPVEAEFWYTPTRNISFGIIAFMDGARFNGSFDTYRVEDARIHYSRATVTPSVRLYAGPWFIFHVDAGAAVYRRLEVSGNPGSKNPLKPSNAGFVRMGFTFRSR